MIMMMMVSLITLAQYPTTKIIKGKEVVIMTVPQAKAIDNKFIKLKDSINSLNLSLYKKDETLRLTNESLIEINNDLINTQEGLSQSLLLNEVYLKEIEKYKKMEFEDKKVLRRTTIGFAGAIALWLFVVIGSSVK